MGKYRGEQDAAGQCWSGQALGLSPHLLCLLPHSVFTVAVHSVLGTCVRATDKILAGLASK